MKTLKVVGAGLAVLLALAITLPVAHASEFNQATELTFDQPVEIPGQVLPAGTYWFQSISSGVGSELIQVYDADHTHLFATLLTTPRDRSVATGHTVLTFARKESDQSTVLKAWYYPGRLTGHEFIYSDEEERDMGSSEWSVLATPDGSYPDTEIAETGE